METRNTVKTTIVGLDTQWGLDHGAWSVLKHFYPLANVPIVELSLDYTQPPAYHYALAGELAVLREKGVLIVGSGNMVHNLRLAAWDKLNTTYAYDWALEAREKMKGYILSGDTEKLIHYAAQGRAFQLAIPTPEHYLPLLYILALKTGKESIRLFNDKPVGGSLTMTSVLINPDQIAAA
jgi:4,5-DOPA dioxygenase extradiol